MYYKLSNEVKTVDNNKIKNFYEKILKDKNTLQKIQHRLQEAQNHYDLEKIIDEIVLPKANEMGLNISKEELLNYENDSIKSLDEEDLLNVSGGMSLKGAVLGGGVFVMALLGLGVTNSPQASAVNFDDIKKSVKYLPKTKTEPATNAANGNTCQQAPSGQDNNNNNADDTDENLAQDNADADNDDFPQELLSLEDTKKSADFLSDSETVALSTKQQAESELAAQEQTDSAYIIEALNLFVAWLYNHYGMTENLRFCNGGTQIIVVGKPNANDNIPNFEFNKSSGEGSASTGTSLFPSPTGVLTTESNYKEILPFKLLCDNDPEKSPKFLAQTCAFIHNHIRKTDDKAVLNLEDYIKIVNSVIENKNKLKGYYSVEIEKLNGIWKEYEPLEKKHKSFRKNIIKNQVRINFLNGKQKKSDGEAEEIQNLEQKNRQEEEALKGNEEIQTLEQKNCQEEEALKGNEEIQNLEQKNCQEEEALKGNKEYNENLEKLQKKKEEINNKFRAIANEIIQIDVNFYNKECKKENAKAFQGEDIKPPNLIKFYNKLEYKYRKNTPALIFETIPKQEQPLFLQSVTNFIEENFDEFLTPGDLTADKKVKLSDEGTFYKVHALMNLLHNFNVMITREEVKDSQEEVTEETTKFIPKYTTERMFMCYVAHSLRNDDDCKKFYGEANKLITVPVAKNETERAREAARLKAAEDRIDKFEKLFDHFAVVKGTPYKEKAREHKNINIVTRNEDGTFVINKDTFTDCADVTAFHVMTLLGYNNGWDYLLQEASGQEETLEKLDVDLAKIKESVETHKKFKLTDNSLKYRLQLLGRHMSKPGSDCNGIFEGILWNIVISNMNSSASEAHYKDIRYAGTRNKTHPGNELDTGFLNQLKVIYNLAKALKGKTETEELINAQKNIDNLSKQIKDGEVSKEVLETTVPGIYNLLLPQGNAIKVTLTEEEDISTTSEDCLAAVKIVVTDKDSQKEKFSFYTRQERIHANVVFNPIIINEFDSKTRKFVGTDSTAQIINYKKSEEDATEEYEEKNIPEEFFNYIYLNDGELEDWAQNRIKSNPILKQYYANIQHLNFLKNIQGLENDLEEIRKLTTNKMFPGTTVDVYKDGKKFAALDLFVFDNYISKSSKAIQTYFNLEDETDPKLFGKESEYYKFLKQHKRIVNLGGVNCGVKFVEGSQDQVEICPFLGPNEESLAITELIIPKQIEFNGKEVSITGVFGEYSFATALPNLEKLTINADNFNIGENVFCKCSKLQTVSFMSETLCIGNRAFCDCSALETVNFSGSVINIGYSAFYDCPALETVNFSKSLIKLEIGEEAFSRSKRALANKIKEINLSGCEKLAEIYVKERAFFNCSALEAINFSESLAKMAIRKSAFFNSGIKSLNFFVSKLTELDIGERAFFKCAALTNVIFSKDLEKLKIRQEAFSNSKIEEINLSVCINLNELDIEKRAFYNCPALVNVNFSGSVINIGDSAFYDCPALADVIFSKGVEKIKIEPEAFSNSRKTFANKIKEINLSVCINLKELDIEKRAFYNCPALANSIFSKGIEKLKIEPEAFSSSNKDLANKIEALDFSVCINLAELDIQMKAFYNCSALSNIIFSNGLKKLKIWKEAFASFNKSCANKIEALDFSSCENLTELDIENLAFYNCISLKEVNIPQNLKPTIGSDAFKNCPVKVMFGYE